MKVEEIILHCSATPEGKDYTVQQIDSWHKARGFKKIGYHYVIYRDGTIVTGRLENEDGAHTVGHNQKALGICYIGGMDQANKKPKDTRTEAQKRSLFELVRSLLNKHNLTLDSVYGHYQFAAKACPSFKIEDFKVDYLQRLSRVEVDSSEAPVV